ncbi:MAG TPA: Crp/Fnr family transcriptional regulator [Polyangiaceae bacterium]|nr:Crp/Fnr family transcriptional regulator [Polyangiaceae bacterium]
MANHEFLEHTALFNGVLPAVTRQLAGAALVHTYARGGTIWRVGDFPDELLIVKSGLVKLTRPAPRGRTSLCWLFGARAILGELVLVNGVPYQNTAIAATQTVSLLSIPRALVLEAAHQDPELALNLFRGFGEKFTALHDKIDVLSAGAVEARLAILLAKLYTQFGDELEDGTLRVGVSLSRQELADMVSTSFETAIRVLARWEREGLVRTDADGFTIGNLSRLEDLGAGAPPKAQVESSGALVETLQ